MVLQIITLFIFTSSLRSSNVSFGATGTATIRLFGFCFPNHRIVADIVAPVAIPSSTKIMVLYCK